MSVYEFIEELSKDHSMGVKEVSSLKNLDPKPFIRTFESTLRELHRVSAEAAERRSQLEKEVAKYELDHSRNILSLAERTESVQSQFKALDDKVTKVSHEMKPLTESLNRKVSAKERTQATVSLIQIYNSFYQTGKSQELDKLMNGSIKSKKTCASTVAQLLTLSQKLISDDLPKSDQCHQTIQKYSETMENWLLEEFSEMYKENNHTGMKNISDILCDYNDGVGVIKNFVNQHNYFINADSLQSAPVDESVWIALSDPANQDLLHESFCDDFLLQIKKVIHDETVVILQVFRDPVTVLGLFTQRVYAQQIQTKVESLIKDSYAVSTLSYLRTLYSLYITVASFTKDLKTFFQSALESNDAKLEDLFLILDQSFSDLFTQHIAESKYFGLEKKTLESIIYAEVSKYETANAGKVSYKLKSRLANDLKGGEEDRLEAEFESLERNSRVGQLKSFMRSHLERTSSLKKGAEVTDEPVPDTSMDLDVSKAEVLLKSSVESLSRMIELTPTKVSEHCIDILEIVTINLGKTYLDIGLEVSYTELGHLDYRADYLDLKFLSNIRSASQILFLSSSGIRSIVLPLVNNTPQIRERIVKYTNSYAMSVEQKINIILNDLLVIFQHKVTNCLSKQKRKDFLPKAGELVDSDTLACESLCQFLSDTFEQLEEHLDSENLKSILLELGMFTFNQLFEHYKNYQTNSMGGIVVTKDIISFQTIIETWKIPELSQKFQLLREIANLFTVQPDLLGSLTTEGQLMRVKPYILRQFISKRSDYSTETSYFGKLRGMI